MSEPRRVPGRFAWLLPLAVFVLVLSLTPSENQRPRKLPFALGSRGYGALRAVLLGRVSRTLVREGACSVVVLPRGAGMNRSDAEQ